MNSKGNGPRIRKQSDQDDTQSEFVRQFKTRPFVFVGTLIILIIVIIAFVLVPAIVPEAGGSTVDLTFGSYNNIPISYVRDNYFAQAQASISQYLQGSLNEGNYQVMAYRIWRQAFEETVIHTAILDEMNQAGYSVPEEVVDKEVAKLPLFQENGRFSVSRYRQLDNVTRISLWKEAQSTIAKRRFMTDTSGLRISSREGDFIAAMASPERTFEAVVFPLSSYPNSEIVEYVAANPAMFQVTHLYRITVNSNEKEAQQILSSIQDGTITFEDAAKTQSHDGYAERGGDMGLKMIFELTTEVPEAEERDKVIKLAAGEYSPVVRVPLGWAIFRAETAPYPVDVQDSANVDKIRGYIMDFERGRIEDWLIQEANVFINLVKEQDFDTALFMRGLEKRSFGPAPVNFGSTDLFGALGDYYSLGEIGAGVSNENFWKTLFFTPLKTPSKPIVVGNTVLVLYPLEETTADSETLEAIKATYTSYWISNHAEQEVRSFFLTNKKLEDRFSDTYARLFSGYDG